MAGPLNTQHYNVFSGGQNQNSSITTAPPWCFLPIIQSSLPPRLWPPINNASTVKLPLSIQWTPATKCCLPGSISSLLAPSPSSCYLLESRCLLLYVLAITCHVVGTSHHLPPHKNTRAKQTLPTTSVMQTKTAQMTTTQMTMPQTKAQLTMQTTRP
jgi:hypothetical protein